MFKSKICDNDVEEEVQECQFWPKMSPLNAREISWVSHMIPNRRMKNYSSLDGQVKDCCRSGDENLGVCSSASLIFLICTISQHLSGMSLSIFIMNIFIHIRTVELKNIICFVLIIHTISRQLVWKIHPSPT